MHSNPLFDIRVIPLTPNHAVQGLGHLGNKDTYFFKSLKLQISKYGMYIYTGFYLYLLYSHKNIRN